MEHDIADHLKSLHTAAVDARNGYDEALRDADVGDLDFLFREMISLHAKHADALALQLRKRGEVADEDGSFMSNIHRAIMDIRSLFGGLDQSVLPGLIDGEERNLSRYNKALDLVGLSEEDRALLLRQRAVIEDAVAKMRSLKASTAA
jgi:uncharacterized protein (TIGR02284 family)